MPKKYMGQLKVKFLTMFDYEINKKIVIWVKIWLFKVDVNDQNLLLCFLISGNLCISLWIVISRF